MSVNVRLDTPYDVFTNLDVITGKVILGISGPETISEIHVKLEGESRSRLSAPQLGGPGYRDHRERSQTELEVHKLLYQVEILFPSPELKQASPKNSAYTLSSGQHEYPFQFKIPFNNACSAINSMRNNFNIPSSIIEAARDTNRHVKKPLPPTLSGFPGEAEVRYYVKATVVRPAFYKENFRKQTDFKFLPIEAPRPPPNRRESYARRQYQFAPHVPILQSSSFFRRQSSAVSSTIPPKISIDGRLPDPAIITCNEPLPLRMLVKKLNETPETIFLQLLQVELIGYTRIRAHELSRQEISNWIIVSLANLNLPLGNSNTPAQRDMEIDSKLWNQTNLPNTVPPTFHTCNLARYYELEIRVGLVYGAPGNLKPELTVQPLRMPVQVYSGIKPSPALLAEMARRGGLPSTYLTLQPGLSPDRPGFAQPSSQPPSPVSFPAPSPSGPSGFQQVSHPAEHPSEAPPPSYEDAMAEDLAPVDGPRRGYDQPDSQPVTQDAKRSGVFGNSERLFS